MNKTETFMVAIMLALALTLATVGMTTLIHHAQAFWGGGYICEAPWAYHLSECQNYGRSDNGGGNYQPINMINGFDCYGECIRT